MPFFLIPFVERTARTLRPLALVAAGLLLAACGSREPTVGERLAEAEGLIAQGDLVGGIQILEELETIEPENVGVLEPLAFAYADRGNHQLASYYFSTIAELGDPTYHLLAAESLISAGNAESAVSSYRVYLDEVPGDGASWHNLSDLLFGLGDAPGGLAAAIRWFENTGEAEAALIAGEYFLQDGNLQQAQDWLRKAVVNAQQQKNPEIEARGLAAVTSLAVDAGQLNAASTLLTRLDERYPNRFELTEYARQRDVIEDWRVARATSSEAATTTADAGSGETDNEAENAGTTSEIAASEVDDDVTVTADTGEATAGGSSAVTNETDAASAMSDGSQRDAESRITAVDASPDSEAGAEAVARAEMEADGPGSTLGDEPFGDFDLFEKAGVRPDNGNGNGREGSGGIPPTTRAASRVAEAAADSAVAVGSDEPPTGDSMETGIDEADSGDALARTDTGDDDEPAVRFSRERTETGPEAASDTPQADDRVRFSEPRGSVGPVVRSQGFQRSTNNERSAPLGQQSASLLMARNLMRDGDYAQAAKLLHRATASAPDDARIWADLADALFRAGDYRFSEAAALEASRLAPDDSRYALLFLRSAQKVREPRRFFKELVNAHRKFPSDPDIILSLARGYRYIASDRRSAAILYRQFLERAPNHPLADTVRSELDAIMSG